MHHPLAFDPDLSHVYVCMCIHMCMCMYVCVFMSTYVCMWRPEIGVGYLPQLLLHLIV